MNDDHARALEVPRPESSPVSADPPKRPQIGAFTMPLRVLTSTEFLAVLVMLGIALRVIQYASNRSLWIDEASLALNIIDRSPRELLGTLDFNQAAPPGFLLLVHGLTSLTGYSEPALRAIPLIGGIGSMVVFAWLARRMLAPFGALFAVLLFSVADGLIYYSSEVKPYSIDVFATLLLLAVAVLLVDSMPTRLVAVLLGIGGAILMTISYAAILVAASLVATFFIAAKHECRATNIARLIPLFLWSSCALAIAAYSWNRTGGIRAAFNDGAATSDSSDPTRLWLLDLIHEVNVLGTGLLGTIGFIQDSLWTQLFKVAAFSFVIGAIALSRHKPLHLLLLLTPIGLALVAWSIGQYPLVPRTTVFLVPIVILLLARGVEATASWSPSPWYPLSTLIALGILTGPIWTASKAVMQSRTREEIKPVLDYVLGRARPGDTLYVHYGAQYALLYYDKCQCLEEGSPFDSFWRFTGRRSQEQFAPALTPLSRDILVGPSAGVNLERQLADLRRLPNGKRIWFLYTHVAGAAEEKFIRQRLIPRFEAIGTRTAEIDHPGAHAYLYEPVERN